MELSVIIPAYNEADRLGPSLERANEWLAASTIGWELIVVDDGSTDATAKVVDKYDFAKLIRHEKNKGKGAAVKTGMLAAKGEYRFFMDADLSTPVRTLAPALAALKAGADVVIGSRTVDRSVIAVHQPLYREYIGRSYNVITRLLGLTSITDTQCGFKGFTAAAAETLFGELATDGFSFDVEVLVAAQSRGMKIAELPVEWRDSARSGVKLFVDPLLMFIELLRISRRRLRNKPKG